MPIPYQEHGLTSGEYYRVPKFNYEECTDAAKKLTAAAKEQKFQDELKAIDENKEWDPVKKALKQGLVHSKIALKALKEYGFESGPDAKKGMSQICTESKLHEDDQELKGAIKEMEVAFGIYWEPPSKKEESAPSAA